MFAARGRGKLGLSCFGKREDASEINHAPPREVDIFLHTFCLILYAGWLKRLFAAWRKGRTGNGNVVGFSTGNAQPILIKRFFLWLKRRVWIWRKAGNYWPLPYFAAQHPGRERRTQLSGDWLSIVMSARVLPCRVFWNRSLSWSRREESWCALVKMNITMEKISVLWPE